MSLLYLCFFENIILFFINLLFQKKIPNFEKLRIDELTN